MHGSQQYLENTQAELLRDGHGGLLLYSARDDQYSSTGRFDANPLAQARMSGTSQLGTVGTLNARTAAALLHLPSDPAQYRTHAHTASSKPPTAVFRSSTTCGTAALANLQHNTTTIALPAEYIRTQRSSRSPQNVWASFDFPKNIPQQNTMISAEQHCASYLRSTLPSKFTTEFNSFPDQTAVSFDDQRHHHTTTTAAGTASGGMEDLHFHTLKHAFSTFGTAEEALLAGDIHAYTNHNDTMNTTMNTTATADTTPGTAPYYDTEIMLEMLTHSPSKVTLSPLLCINWLRCYYFILAIGLFSAYFVYILYHS